MRGTATNGLFIEPGRIGDWVLSIGVVRDYCKRYGVNPIWVAREELRELIVEQFGALAWGASIPSHFRLLDVPTFLLKMGLLRKREGEFISVMSSGNSARLAVMFFPRRLCGYVDWRDRGRCLGIDGAWRNYDVSEDHLVSRAALVLSPRLIERAHRPAWYLNSIQAKLARMNRSAQRAKVALRDRGVKEQRFVLFSTGARWAYRCWTQEGWVELARRLIAGGRSVVLCGTPGEQSELKEIQSMVGMQNCVLLPLMSVPEFVELGRSASCMVTLDSGPMHIAAAVKTPCVALYGPSDPRLTVGVAEPDMMRVVRWEGCPYWPCIDPSNSNDGGGCRQGDHICMRNLSASSVKQAIDEILQQ